MPITFSKLKQVLDLNNERYSELSLDETYKLLVWEDRGRIFGPYSGDDSVGMAWVSEELSSPERYAGFKAKGGWNVGGDRLWVAPEFPFFTKQRSRFNESYTVQDSLDPGHYHFTKADEKQLKMSAELEAELYEHQHRRKTFSAERALSPCKNPLRDAMPEGVKYCGFTQSIELSDTSPLSPMELEIWNLFQVRAGGVFLIPYLGNDLDYVDYYAPSLGEVLNIHEHYASVKVESCAEHKVGFKAFQTFGRVGYLLQEGDGLWSLLIRSYYNNPSDTYIKEPSDRPGENGCSLFIYMNDTRSDGFAELETTGETFCASEKDRSALSLNYWFYRGELSDLKAVLSNLLGIGKSLEV